jgi:hypothetical protein
MTQDQQEKALAELERSVLKIEKDSGDMLVGIWPPGTIETIRAALAAPSVPEEVLEVLDGFNRGFVKSDKDNMEFTFRVPYTIYHKMIEGIAILNKGRE